MSPLDFDGVDDYVDHGDINAIDGAAALTVAFWLRPDVLTTDDKVLGKSNGVNRFEIRTNSGTASQLEWRNAVGGGQGTMPVGSLVATEWHHYAFVFDGSQTGDANRLKGYKDGVAQVLAFGESIGATVLDNGTGVVTIARRSDAAAEYFDCKVAHIMVWSSALTAAQIAQQAMMLRPIVTANLVRWWPYDDGTSAVDYSGNGTTSTVTGAVQATTTPPVSGGKPSDLAVV